MPESREDSVYLAKLAEQAERYEGTCHCYGQWVILRGLPLSFSLRDGREYEARRFVRPRTHCRGT
jgi:hypothetical protein